MLGGISRSSERVCPFFALYDSVIVEVSENMVLNVHNNNKAY